jgi:phosphatidate cytidylyltransferase
LDKVLRKRGITALFFVAIVTSTLISGRLGTTIFLCLVLMFTTYELIKISNNNDFRGRLYGVINLFIFYTTLFLSNELISKYMPYFGVLCNLILIYLLFNEKIKELSFVSKNLWFIYPLVPFLSYTYILQEFRDANWLLLLLLMLIWVCDSAAYLVGRKLGKRKLFERVSPKKTIEGALGSLIFTPLFSLLIPLLFPEIAAETGNFFWVIVGLIVAVFGTLGDLYQSQIKRIFGFKDSGRIMPGHGGIWDRFDSFIYLLPFYSLLLLFIEKNLELI